MTDETAAVGRTLTAALVYAVAVGLLTGAGWAGYAVGVVCAAVLWLIMLCGALGLGGRPAVAPLAYAVACVGALGAGYFLVAAVGGGNPVWWPVGVILAGAVAPWAGAVTPRDDHRD